jgi:hypothetical protein
MRARPILIAGQLLAGCGDASDDSSTGTTPDADETSACRLDAGNGTPGDGGSDGALGGPADAGGSPRDAEASRRSSATGRDLATCARGRVTSRRSSACAWTTGEVCTHDQLHQLCAGEQLRQQRHQLCLQAHHGQRLQHDAHYGRPRGPDSQCRLRRLRRADAPFLKSRARRTRRSGQRESASNKARPSPMGSRPTAITRSRTAAQRLLAVRFCPYGAFRTALARPSHAY